MPEYRLQKFDRHLSLNLLDLSKRNFLEKQDKASETAHYLDHSRKGCVAAGEQIDDCPYRSLVSKGFDHVQQ